MPNAELAYRVLDAVTEHAEHFDMDHWARGPVSVVGLDELTAPEASCGTTACFAGWTLALAGMKVDSNGNTFDSDGVLIGFNEVALTAAAILGLDGDRADYLFLGTADKDVPAVVAEIFGPRPEAA